MWRSYLGDLLAETTKVYAGGGTMNECVAKVVQILAAKYQSRFPNFSGSVAANVEKAYRVVSEETK